MKIKHLIVASAIAGLTAPALAAEVTVMSWGGAYTKSQVEAYHKPFTAETGIKVNSVDSDNPATPIKAQVEAGNVTVDVADVEFSDAVRLCDEGLLEEIDSSMLPAAPDEYTCQRRLHRWRHSGLCCCQHRLVDGFCIQHSHKCQGT